MDFHPHAPNGCTEKIPNFEHSYYTACTGLFHDYFDQAVHV